MSKSLPIQGFHHIAISTRDVDACRDFYCNLLGFQVLRRPPFDFNGAWLFNYGLQVHIIENPAYVAEREQLDTRGDHFAFRVDEMDPVREELLKRGVSFVERVNAGGIPQIFFKDPDGHQIEVTVVGDPSIGYEG